MTIVLQILVTIVILSVLVTVHELGHYTAGRLLGFTITEFAVGMGPKVWGFKKKGIEYNLRAFPIGGMCQFYGEDDGVSDARCFNAQKAWKRAIVLAAGPVMNFVLAFLIAIGMYMGWGTYDISQVEVLGVNENGAAMEAGLEIGDRILRVNGEAVEGIDSLSVLIDKAEGEIDLEVRRGKETLNLYMTPYYDEAEGRKLVGITIGNPRVPNDFFTAVKNGAGYCWDMAGIVFESFGMLFRGEAGVEDLSGVVGVTRVVGLAISYGWDVVVGMAVMISVNLGVMNLLPIPALDGGRLLFVLIEWIRGKPVPPEKEGLVHGIGFILLMVLMVVLVIKDVWQWIAGVPLM